MWSDDPRCLCYYLRRGVARVPPVCLQIPALTRALGVLLAFAMATAGTARAAPPARAGTPAPSAAARASAPAAAAATASTASVAPASAASGAGLPAPGAGDAYASFTVAAGTGSLFVLLRHRTGQGVELHTPAGQSLTTENIWRVGRWFADEGVDAISVDAPAAGNWRVVGGTAGDATLFVARDVKLRAVDAPQFIADDRPSTLRWQLQAQGKAIDPGPIADLLVARARLHGDTGADQDLPVRLIADSVLEVAVPRLPAGGYRVELEAWVKTLGLHARHVLFATEVPTIRFERRGANTLLWVATATAGLAPETLGLVVTVRGPDRRQRFLMGTRLADDSFHVFISGTEWRGMSGPVTVDLELQARTVEGRAWRAPKQTITLDHGVPTLAAAVLPVAAPPPAVSPAPAPLVAAREPVDGPGPQHAIVVPVAAPVVAAAAQPVAGVAQPTAGPVTAAQAHQAPGRRPEPRRAPPVREPAPAGPTALQLVGLAAANAVLIGLLAWRARQRVSGRVRTATAERVAAAALAASPAAEAAADNGPAGSASAEPIEPAVAAPVIPVDELVVDASLLSDLAELAETQSDLRAAPTADAAA